MHKSKEISADGFTGGGLLNEPKPPSMGPSIELDEITKSHVSPEQVVLVQGAGLLVTGGGIFLVVGCSVTLKCTICRRPWRMTNST